MTGGINGTAMGMFSMLAEQEVEALASLTPAATSSGASDECDGPTTRRSGEPLLAVDAACPERRAAGEQAASGAYRRPTPGASR